MAEMTSYERTAMEPFPDYDLLPLYERATLYARQFRAMYNRKPIFSREDIADIERSKTSIEVSRKDLYKPPPERKPKPKPEEEELTKLPGPWQNQPKPPPPPRISDGDNRLERLRQGWDVRDKVK